MDNHEAAVAAIEVVVDLERLLERSQELRLMLAGAHFYELHARADMDPATPDPVDLAEAHLVEMNIVVVGSKIKSHKADCMALGRKLGFIADSGHFSDAQMGDMPRRVFGLLMFQESYLYEEPDDGNTD